MGDGKPPAGVPARCAGGGQRVGFGQRWPVIMFQRAQAGNLALVRRIKQPVHHRHQPGGDGQAFGGRFRCIFGRQAGTAGRAIKPLSGSGAAGNHILIQLIKIGAQPGRWRP